jgi:hypothetical protein
VRTCSPSPSRRDEKQCLVGLGANSRQPSRHPALIADFETLHDRPSTDCWRRAMPILKRTPMRRPHRHIPARVQKLKAGKRLLSHRLLPPSPPAEKTTARQDQAGQARVPSSINRRVSFSGQPKAVLRCARSRSALSALSALSPNQELPL